MMYLSIYLNFSLSLSGPFFFQAYKAFMDDDMAKSSKLDFPSKLVQCLMTAAADGAGSADEDDVERLAQEILADLEKVADKYVEELNSKDTKPLANEIHGIYKRLVPDKN